ncbi:MAG TPA: hypothetical protein VK157_17680 [Phycisphaerales bacterium]|nr:hypothetical protein [Phycisphaerales bacterium]
MKFVNPFNPTETELRAWAADADAMYPDEMSQDWDLVVAAWERASLIVELAGDESCPQQQFFLLALEALATRCLRCTGQTGEPCVREFLASLRGHPSPAIQLFREQTLAQLDKASRDDLYYRGCY